MSFEAVANQWANGVFTELDWIEDVDRYTALGEGGGFFVTSPDFPYAGYLKPIYPSAADHPRAANEKIASDIAHLIGVSVPPVLLYRRPNCPKREEPRTCISMVIFAEFTEWDYVKGATGQVAEWVSAALKRGSGILAFDAYLANMDRLNTRNTIFASDEAILPEGQLIFLDYANALNYDNRWQQGRWATVEFPMSFAELRQAADWSTIDPIIQKIEALSEEAITEIVQRIPDDYMEPTHKTIVLEGLLERRTLIRPVLANRMGV